MRTEKRTELNFVPKIQNILRATHRPRRNGTSNNPDPENRDCILMCPLPRSYMKGDLRLAGRAQSASPQPVGGDA
jgi:hypothetical protein